MSADALLTPRQAAEKLGMSYPALKHWILTGRIRTVKTPGGHHRVPLEALEEFLPAEKAMMGPTQISGRNQLLGTVMSVTIDGLLAKVVIAIGSQRVTAIITADAARDLSLKVGETAVALIKATEVMVGKPSDMYEMGDAPSCPTCGAIMVRNGSCYRCMSCGSTSGCS